MFEVLDFSIGDLFLFRAESPAGKINCRVESEFM